MSMRVTVEDAEDLALPAKNSGAADDRPPDSESDSAEKPENKNRDPDLPSSVNNRPANDVKLSVSTSWNPVPEPSKQVRFGSSLASSPTSPKRPPKSPAPDLRPPSIRKGSVLDPRFDYDDYFAGRPSDFSYRRSRDYEHEVNLSDRGSRTSRAAVNRTRRPILNDDPRAFPPEYDAYPEPISPRQIPGRPEVPAGYQGAYPIPVHTVQNDPSSYVDPLEDPFPYIQWPTEMPRKKSKSSLRSIRDVRQIVRRFQELPKATEAQELYTAPSSRRGSHTRPYLPPSLDPRQDVPKVLSIPRSQHFPYYSDPSVPLSQPYSHVRVSENQKTLNFGRQYLYDVNLLNTGEQSGFEDYSLEKAATFKSNHSASSQLDLSPGAELDPTIVQVFQSTHVSRTPERGHAIAVLYSSISNKAQDRDNRDEGFRWLNLRTLAINIQLMSTQQAVTHLSGLRSTQKTLVLRLLQEVSKTCEKESKYGTFLNPTVIRFNGNAVKQDHPTKKESATFVCMPWFSVEPPEPKPAHMNRTVHRPRALLQTRYKLESTEKMDRGQVICRVKNEDEYVHVPQLWMIVLDDTIITCSPMRVDSLGGSFVKIEAVSAPTKAQTGPNIVRFVDLYGQVYLFPVDRCRTWFELLEKIAYEYLQISSMMYSEETGEGFELIAEDGGVVSDQNWVAHLSSEKSDMLKIFAQYRTEVFSESSSEEEEMIPDEETNDARTLVNGELGYVPSGIVRPPPSSSSRGRLSVRRQNSNEYYNRDAHSEVSDMASQYSRRSSLFSTASQYDPTNPGYEYIADDEPAFHPNSRQRTPRYHTKHNSKKDTRVFNHLENGRAQNTSNSSIYYKPVQNAKSSYASSQKSDISQISEATEPDENTSDSKIPVTPEKPDSKSPLSKSGSPKNTPIFTWPLKDQPTEDKASGNGISVEEQGIGADNSFSTQKDGRHIAQVLKNAKKQLKISVQKNADYKFFSCAAKGTKEKFDAALRASDEEVRIIRSAGIGSDEDSEYDEPLLDVIRRLVMLISTVIEAFVPPDYRSPLTDVCWGSVVTLLESATSYDVEQSIHYRRHLKILHRRFTVFLGVIKEIQYGVSDALGAAEPRFYIPSTLVQAFQQLVMVLCIGTRIDCISENGMGLRRSLIKYSCQCEKLLRQGKEDLTMMVHTGYFGAAQIHREVTSRDVAALLMERLIQISDTDNGFQLIEVYREYMTILEQEVLDTPSVAVFDNIQRLVEELETIDTITKEQSVVIATARAIRQGDSWRHSNEQIGSTCLTASMNYLQQQHQDIQELIQLADHRKQLLTQKLELRKESNSQAVLIFTVVTTIFLPLSFSGKILADQRAIDSPHPGPGLAPFKAKEED
ncbi:MAG: hypothetical protein M1814_006670 [Vezdaea aestivalis]|nr:MAG: hypothetical protein M1814_006670 [Vezdaea aestivalis]